MIAIYARQSVEKADSISIEQQIEVCRYETRGEEFRVYTDRGYSGKNTNRPQFTEMMKDIGDGLISTVVVYKLDRISRSILDFSNMMELFGRYGVKFVSATEKFDTSSPMGNAMLNICIVFAQLERETIQKRVADAYYSRSSKSLYMGGPVPYGFRKVPVVIDGIHTSMYEALPEEAEVVRLIYNMYSRADTSCGDVADHLNELGIDKRGSHWARPRIRELVMNPVYVRSDEDVYDFFISNGAEVTAPPAEYTEGRGCYCYSDRNGKRSSSSVLAGKRIVPAPHTGIVDSGIWLRCREKCMSRQRGISSQKAKNSWLCGKVRCGACGCAMTARQYSNGRRYLFCSASCGGAGTVYTDMAEQLTGECIKLRLAGFSVEGEHFAAVWDGLSFCGKRRVADALIRVIYVTGSSITVQWRVGLHPERNGEALRIAQDKLDSRNFYACNPSFDKNCGKK